jgi:acyl carrier protein
MTYIECDQGDSVMDELLPLIMVCTRETADERGVSIPEDFGPETPLFGREGVFDSMGLVSLIVAVEEAVSDEYGVEITIADQRAMSQKRSPFLNSAALATYAGTLIAEAS